MFRHLQANSGRALQTVTCFGSYTAFLIELVEFSEDSKINLFIAFDTKNNISLFFPPVT